MRAELRDQIYEYVAHNDAKPFTLNTLNYLSEDHGGRRLSLQRSSKQLRAEYIPVYFRHATIVINWTDWRYYPERFLEMLPTQPRNLFIRSEYLQDFLHELARVQILPLLAIRARNPNVSIAVIYEDSDVYRDSSVVDSDILNLMLEHSDADWLKLVRKREVVSVKLAVGSGSHIREWHVRLNGVRSDMTEREFNILKQVAANFPTHSHIYIQDWVPKRKGHTNRTLVWGVL